ncbi:MAG TPA: DUF465 domain-containing protein [Burkholderiaceae bacterium]|nr:DUF465 domain-containing protein [Burkholderiaceae bacterium]
MQSADNENELPHDPDEIRRRITELQIEHRDLDRAIAQLDEQSGCDELQLRRLKKRKLLIKDAITRLEMGLVPDIPA